MAKHPPAAATPSNGAAKFRFFMVCFVLELQRYIMRSFSEGHPQTAPRQVNCHESKRTPRLMKHAA